ncbi:MAG: excinuclease ABC subunit UvrB [Kiritimatiellia bacterium]
MANLYKLDASYQPAGDQPAAIEALCRGLVKGQRFQTLEGVTGSGKTFTIANVIAQWNQPALIISHNKTLAAQLYSELKSFFPANAVEYFVSYYDYYQPEAYIPQTDTFIEKDASINEEIERLRLSATNALLMRRDVIIVSSVSCIYGLGSPEDYSDMLIQITVGDTLTREAMLEKLVAIQYSRNDYEPLPGNVRVRGDCVDVFPSYSRLGLRVTFFGDEIEMLQELDPVSGRIIRDMERISISPAKHFVMPHAKIETALSRIKDELDARLQELQASGRLIEAQRLQQRTLYDLEMMKELGYCSGIENYSRHLSGRGAGEPPATLLHYFPDDFLTILDESHVTVPQIRAMFYGDQSRKQTLIEHGFRLPSAADNRPLAFDEFLTATGPILFTSATPGPFEKQVSASIVPQIIRPTGLLDPPVEVRPLEGQIDDLMECVRVYAEKQERVLVTTLTKRTAEDLTDYLTRMGCRVEYLHSDIDAIERVEILRRLRQGAFDCLIGINLLREGLDLPEVALVAILDADKEGFLRSETALIQTAGRAARHVAGSVILYADRVTDAMQRMIDITTARRERQLAFNASHKIVPVSTIRAIDAGLRTTYDEEEIERRVVAEGGESYDVHAAVQELEREMLEAAAALEFERAAALRDRWQVLKQEQGQTGGTSERAGKQKRGKQRKGL